MSSLIVDNVRWKKGELGTQTFLIFESDGETARDGTNKTYTFKMWKQGGGSIKSEGSLTLVAGKVGEYTYVIKASDTDTVDQFLGEIIEEASGSNIRTESFNVEVLESSDR